MFAHFSFACLVSTMRHVAAHPTHTNDMMARDTTRILVHATLDEAHTFLALKIDCFFSTVFLIGPYIIIQYTGKTLHIFKDRTALGSKWCYVYPHICVQRILWWQLQRAILLCCRQKCDFIHILAFFGAHVSRIFYASTQGFRPEQAHVPQYKRSIELFAFWGKEFFMRFPKVVHCSTRGVLQHPSWMGLLSLRRIFCARNLTILSVVFWHA